MIPGFGIVGPFWAFAFMGSYLFGLRKGTSILRVTRLNISYKQDWWLKGGRILVWWAPGEQQSTISHLTVGMLSLHYVQGFPDMVPVHQCQSYQIFADVGCHLEGFPWLFATLETTLNG